MVTVKRAPLTHESSGSISVYSARSSSRPFMRHFVLWSHDDNDVLLCTCEGWQVHAKCWHQDDLRMMMREDDLEHPEDTYARAHVVDVHNIDTSRREQEGVSPAQVLLELRASGECTHHVEGFDT